MKNYEIFAGFSEQYWSKGVFVVPANSKEEALKLFQEDPERYLEDVIDSEPLESDFDTYETYGEVIELD